VPAFQAERFEGEPAASPQSKHRIWYNELRFALEQDPTALAEVARKVIALAKNGIPWAVTEIRNTLDGKPKETLDINETVHFIQVDNANTLAARLKSSLARRVGESAGSPERTVQ
jgi:hypothetical protein